MLRCEDQYTVLGSSVIVHRNNVVRESSKICTAHEIPQRSTDWFGVDIRSGFSLAKVAQMDGSEIDAEASPAGSIWNGRVHLRCREKIAPPGSVTSRICGSSSIGSRAWAVDGCRS